MDRCEALCDRIASLGLTDLRFTTQASPIGFAQRPDVARKMIQAGIVSIFLGIENVSKQNLKLMHKPNTPDLIRKGVEAIQREGGVVIAGIINGLRHDDLEALRENYEFVRSLGITGVMDQLLTPYPCTPLRDELLQQGVVENPTDFRWYDGYFSNVRTEHLSAAELSYARWRIRREIVGMWRATPGDWRYFRDYLAVWELGLRQLVWVHERMLELVHGVEGRYKLQMRHYMLLNDFGIEIPGVERAAYHPVFGDRTDPFYESRPELLARRLQPPRAPAWEGPLPEKIAVLVQHASSLVADRLPH
jgi:radical SAM superfamily enzyme YgiQ (UPF0313 family)